MLWMLLSWAKLRNQVLCMWSSCRLNHEVVSMQCRVVFSCVDQSFCYCMLHHKIVGNGCGRWTRAENSYSKLEAYETDDGQVWALSNSYLTGCCVTSYQFLFDDYGNVGSFIQVLCTLLKNMKKSKEKG